MSVNRYQNETSPRKVDPEKGKKKQRRQDTLRLVEEQRQTVRLSKKDKQKRMKALIVVGFVFAMLLTVSYRNSQINIQFSEIKSMEVNLALLEKENEQARVNIENGLNLNNIEKQAKEELGMQKIMTSQTKYVVLTKYDYIEPVAEEFTVEEESIFKKIRNIVGNMF